MEQFLNCQKQGAFVNDIDLLVFRSTEKVLNQNFMTKRQFMEFQLDQIQNDVRKENDLELENELKNVEDQMQQRLSQLMVDLDNNLVKIEEIQQIKDKKELIKLEIQENERDLKRRKDELVDKLKFVECSLGLIQNEQRIEKQQQNHYSAISNNARNYRDRKQYYEEIKKQQLEAQQFIDKYNKQSKEVLKNIDERYKQELEKDNEIQKQNRDQEIKQLEEKKKQRHIKSEQNLHYIKQRQQMRDQDINSQNKAYNQIKNQYNDIKSMKEQQYMEELKKMNEIKVYQQKIERIKNSYKNHIQDDYLKFDSEYQQRLKQKEVERIQKLQNNQNQWQCPQVYKSNHYYDNKQQFWNDEFKDEKEQMKQKRIKMLDFSKKIKKEISVSVDQAKAKQVEDHKKKIHFKPSIDNLKQERLYMFGMQDFKHKDVGDQQKVNKLHQYYQEQKEKEFEKNGYKDGISNLQQLRELNKNKKTANNSVMKMEQSHISDVKSNEMGQHYISVQKVKDSKDCSKEQIDQMYGKALEQRHQQREKVNYLAELKKQHNESQIQQLHKIMKKEQDPVDKYNKIKIAAEKLDEQVERQKVKAKHNRDNNAEFVSDKNMIESINIKLQLLNI